MKNIHVLPTDKPSRLHYWDGILKINNSDIPLGLLYQNIYITSDEEIKVGDWYINTFVSEREQKPQTHTEKRHLINHQKDYRFHYCKKIILTTDQDLIKDGVQAIYGEFLNWFVKNPSCEEVKIEKVGGKYFSDRTIGVISYDIIIPKEEPKQDWQPTQGEEVWIKVFSNWSKGIYIGYDITRSTHLVREDKKVGGHLFSSSEILPYKAMPNEPKQESFVEKMIPLQLKYNLAMLDVMKQESLDEIEIISKQRIHKYRPMNPHPTSFFIGFRDGYKLARETSYSEEEVLEIIRQYALEEHLITSSKPDIWFEQFKKK